MAKLDYKTLIIQSAVTALTVAVVNNMFKGTTNKGLGMPTKLLLNLSLERQAQFADVVTISNYKNREFLENQMTGIDPTDPQLALNANTTTIGNCAFVALYTPFPEIREKAALILSNIKQNMI